MNFVLGVGVEGHAFLDGTDAVGGRLLLETWGGGEIQCK